MGALARVSMLRSDYRQYPTYPHSYTSHLFLGFIAALAGAVAIPALLEREWTAVTFFLIVSQQFREIRSMERDSLKALEDSQLVTRGSDYIEDIARTFEARYYIVILVAAASSGGFELSSIWTGLLCGTLAFLIGALLMRQERLGDVVIVERASLNFKGGGPIRGRCTHHECRPERIQGDHYEAWPWRHPVGQERYGQGYSGQSRTTASRLARLGLDTRSAARVGYS
jgi:hypothetical protein